MPRRSKSGSRLACAEAVESSDPRTRLRVLIDSSIIARALLPSENPDRAVAVIFRAISAARFDLILPPELLEEVADLLTFRPYFAARVLAESRVEFLQFLSDVGTPAFPYFRPFAPVTRDPDDDYLLAHALRDQVDFLVTGDRDLLDLADAYDRPRIVNAGDFLHELRAQGLI